MIASDPTGTPPELLDLPTDVECMFFALHGMSRAAETVLDIRPFTVQYILLVSWENLHREPNKSVKARMAS